MMREPRRNILIFARPLYEEDYARRGGFIQTPLGPLPFAIGDFLTRSYRGEWLITREDIGHYRLVLGDSTGWACYTPADAAGPYSH